MNNNMKLWALIGVLVIFWIIVFSSFSDDDTVNKVVSDVTGVANLKIISSTENKDIENVVFDYARKNNLNVQIDYAGTLEIMDKLNNGEEYDAVWLSNSMWMYMLKNVRSSNSKIINMNPVVFGIRKSKARELGFVDRDVKLGDIIKVIREGKLKFAMTSATQTNTGATAYLGFLSVLSGNPEVLTNDNLNNDKVKSEMKELLNGVSRTSGSEEYLEELYLGNNCDSIITYETSIININKKIKNEDDYLYAVYPVDGVSISDSVFAYLGETNTSKEEIFLKIQAYLLSNKAQDELIRKGRRVWYGGIKNDVDEEVFNPKYGIDTTKYLTPIKYPSTDIIKKALGMYQSELRRPVHTLFALDYSGSMMGDGYDDLSGAMKYILNSEEASQDYLQFANTDKISLILFNSKVSSPISTNNGLETDSLIKEISDNVPVGRTNIYDTVTEAYKYLKNEDYNTYNVSIVLMTDGLGNAGSYSGMTKIINDTKNKIPVYSIMFGSASSDQLLEIADMTGGKVFDGREDLKLAFKEVRGYN